MKSLLRMTVALAIVCLGVGAQAEGVNQPAVPNLKANSGIQVGIGVICNSTDQIRRYLAVKNDADAIKKSADEASIQHAVQVVNHEANDERACGMAMVAFVVGDETANVDVTDGTMHVHEITVVAVAIDGGWRRIQDTVQYTAFFEKLESV